MPFSITNTDTKVDTVGGAFITYNAGGNPSIGASDTNRVIVIVILARANSSAVISAVTVNGANANQVTSAAAGAANGMASDIWYITEASASTGGLTTAAVVVTYAGTTIQSMIGVYRVITQTVTPTGNALDNASAQTLSVGVTVPAGGGAIAGVACRNVGAVTWSGASTVADFDTAFNASNEGSGTHTLTNGAVTFTATIAAALSEMSLSVVAWPSGFPIPPTVGLIGLASAEW